MAAEQGGDNALAIRMYDLVSRTDPGFASACFGLARCYLAGADRRNATLALDRIPQTSSLHVRARVEAARALIAKAAVAPRLEELTGASATIEALALEGMERHRLTRQVLETALRLVTSGTLAPNAGARLFGRALSETELRLGLEQSLRAMAHLTTGPDRIRLVDEANSLRPRTLL